MLGIGPEGPLGPRRVAEDGAAFGERPVGGRDVPAAGSALTEGEALAVLVAVDGVGPVSLERLLATFGGPDAVLAVARERGAAEAFRHAARDPEEPSRTALTDAAAKALVVAARDPGPTLAAMAGAGVVALAWGDPAYPQRLRRIELPPRVLFVRGPVEALEAGAAVAVVGTRRPTDGGRRTAARLGAALARADALVVSGLAVGIDGAAHSAVVGAGGVTVAVTGGGHARLFPRLHDRLADAIVAGGGAIVSEHAPGVEPSRGTFPRRNRVISGLADAVVVVEAGARSGALLTAAWALEQGRESFFVPGSIDAPQSAGCLAWLRDFAGAARIVSGIPQLLEDLGLPAAAAFGSWPEPAAGAHGRRRASLVPAGRATRAPGVAAVSLDMPAREAGVLRALALGAATADELAAVTGLPIGAVLGALTGLEERGLASGTYGRYRVPDEALDGVLAEPVTGRPAALRNPAA